METPIQHLVNSKLEWFVCKCGKSKFHMSKSFSEGGEPQLGIVEQHFSCSCGSSYVWEYGNIYNSQSN